MGVRYGNLTPKTRTYFVGTCEYMMILLEVIDIKRTKARYFHVMGTH